MMSEVPSLTARDSSTGDNACTTISRSPKSATSHATPAPAGRGACKIKRQRSTTDESMDCSQHFNSKSTHVADYSDGALLCLPLQLRSEQMTSRQVGMELARCLQEPKYNLVKDTVEVLGVERTVELFKRTSEIQKHGGLLSSEGDKKRAPGGVFFSLVKSSVSEEEKKQIFAKDNRLTAKQAKRARDAKRRKKWREEEDKRKKALQDKAQKQLECFRRDLSVSKEGSEQLVQSPDGNKGKGETVQSKGELEPDYTDLDDPSCHEDGELIEGWRNVGMDDGDDDFASHISDYEHLRRKMAPSQKVEVMDSDRVNLGRSEECEEMQGRRSEKDEEVLGRRSEGWIVGEVGRARDGVSLEEKMAAEQFERTNECDLDFGIDLS